MPPKSRALASKEASLFKELLTQYETRQLKKGLKTAEQILKKNPDHGETTCMKGLVLVHMGRRDEGVECVKKGMRLDLTSHICWHVFGLIQKGEKKYEEALKSYTQALKFDKDNLNILRDSAQLQTQLRMYDALVETRHLLLSLRPALRQNWLALAVAYRLQGNLAESKSTLATYIGMLKNVPDYDVEHSSVLLYYVHTLEDVGEVTEALRTLDASARSRAIVDRSSIMECRARLLSKLGSTEEAEHAWQALIEHNAENYDYYAGFIQNSQPTASEANTAAWTAPKMRPDDMSEDKKLAALEILCTFAEQTPRAVAPRRLALNLASGDKFKDLVEPYLLNGLQKGVPSLFVDIKSLYSSPEKASVIESIVDSLREKLSSSAPAVSDDPPTTYLWTLYFLAQHHSHLRHYSEALALLDTAITHTPTLPELHTCKARVLKRAGDPLGAAKCMNDARLLDGQDRYLNTKCAKYRMRAGMVDEASDILGLFTKKDAPSPGQDLEDMQSMLYLIEEGNALHRLKKLGPALKKFMAVQKVYDEVENDQYDFHGYCIRKYTLNIYHTLINWETGLRNDRDYAWAAMSAAKIWVTVHDDPSLISPQLDSNTETDKKAKKKAKKAMQKVQDSTKKLMAPTSSNEDKGLEPPDPKDEDPEGLTLVAATDGLERARAGLLPLAEFMKGDVEYWVVSYDIAVRRKKYLQAAQALIKARECNAEYPELHIRIVHIHKTVSSLPQPPPSPMGPILSEALKKLIPNDQSLDTFNSQYIQRHSPSATHLLGAASVSQALGTPITEIEDLLFQCIADKTIDVKTALATINLLKSLSSSRTDEYRIACAGIHPLATVFQQQSPAEVVVSRKAAINGHIIDEADDEKEIIS